MVNGINSRSLAKRAANFHYYLKKADMLNSQNSINQNKKH